MKHFTPELYIKLNDKNSRTAMKAEDQWEKAIEAYRSRISEIRKQLPKAVRDLAEKTCLHDAEYLGLTTVPAPQSCDWLSFVSVRHHADMVFLLYFSPEEPFIHQPVSNWSFSPENVHWLYDEVDIVEENYFLHEILLSDGRILSLRFTAFDMVVVNPHTNGRKDGSKSLLGVPGD